MKTLSNGTTIRTEDDFNFKMRRIDIITEGASNSDLAQGLHELAKVIRRTPDSAVLIAVDVSLTESEYVVFAVLEDLGEEK